MGQRIEEVEVNNCKYEIQYDTGGYHVYDISRPDAPERIGQTGTIEQARVIAETDSKATPEQRRWLEEVNL